MRDRVFLAALSLLLCALPAPSAHARPAPTDTIYVDRDATGAEDGSSWNDAYTSLQEALEEARTNGTDDAVWIAEGTYYPDEGDGVQADDRTASFHVESGIDLHGRFEGNEDALRDRVLERGMNETVLSGEIQQDADSTNNAYTVLRLTGGAAGEIQVTGGQADGTGAQGEGGGAYITGGELHHAILTGNYGLRGSAVYAENSPTLAVVRATGNHATETGTVYLDGGAATLRHLTIADNTAEGGASGVQFVDSDATVEDFAFGPDATNDVQSVDFVTATYQGTVLEEGSTLSDADITIRNNTADTLITTTETNASGDYQTTHTYPDDQSYEAAIIADKADHQADTTTVSLGTTDNTYSNDFNLERLIYDLTINTNDANTGNAVNASGTVTTANSTLANYTTGNNGQTTIEINTASDEATSEANTTDYDQDAQTVSLGGTEDITVTNSLPPIVYTFTGNVDGENGDLANASVALAEPNGGQVSTTTDSNGDYTAEATINDGFEENESIDITADEDEYNQSTKQTTADPNDRDKTTNFQLTPVTTSYTVEGTVSSSDGDTVTNTTINLNTPNGTTVSTDNTDTNGNYTTNTSEDELGGNQATLASNPAGYDQYTKDLTLSEGTNTENITLQEILRDYDFDINKENGNPLTNASVDIDENEGDNYRDVATLTTNSDGQASTTLSVDEQIVSNDELRIQVDKDSYNPTTFTHTVNEENKTFTTTLTEETTTVTATIQGNTDQEGINLPNTEITFTNTKADTTVGTTTSDENGNYSFTTSYPEDQAYTIQVDATTGDHSTGSQNITLGGTDDTYNADFNLERLVYDVTINTDDATTGSSIDASGDILNNGTSLASYSTGGDGEATVGINTSADEATSEANTANYNEDTTTLSLGGNEDVSVTNALTPIVFTYTGNVDDDANNDLDNANISLDDPDGNTVTTDTDASGDYNLGVTVNDGFTDGEGVDITADKAGFNASTKTRTNDADNTTQTVDFSLAEQVTNYTVEGNVSSSDGDTVTNTTINLNTPGGTTVATDNTDTNGDYTTSTSQDELGGNQAQLASNPAGYDQYTEDITVQEGTNTENITLQEILRNYDFDINKENGNPLTNASIDIDEDEGGQYRDVTTLTTDGSGNASTTLSVDEQIIGGDELTITATKNGYNTTETTDIVDNKSETITLSLEEQTITYDVSGTVTDEDGDQLANTDVLIQTPSDNTVASTTTGSNGGYSVSVTQDELGGDTGEVETNPTGYNKVESTTTFNEGSNTVDLSLSLTEYTRTFDVDKADGSALADASIDGDETTNGDRDVFTATTNTNGEHTETLTIDDMTVDGDQLEYTVDKDGYQSTTKTETLTDTTKTINAALNEENTTDRITITFNPKIVGDDLYSGGYGEPFDYTVSTDDTTFTATGSTTADVPIADGDELEISTSDSAYLSTVVANNTDTEPEPFSVSGFPDEPDYQNTTIGIPKSDVVNQYQVVGFPNQSTDGRNMDETFLPHVNEALRYKNRPAGDETLEETAIWIIEDDADNWNNKAENAIAEVRGVLPYPTSDPVFLPNTDALVDSAEARNEFNYHYVERGGNSNNLFYDSGYIKSGNNSFSNSAGQSTRISETYSGLYDMDELGSNDINEYIFNDDQSFDQSEAALPLRFIYNAKSGSNIQP